MAFWNNGIFSFILSVLSGTLITIMLYTFLKHEFNCKTYEDRTKTVLNIMTLVLLTVYLTFALHTTIDALYAIISTASGSFHAPWCISQFLEMLMYAFGKVTMYLFFVRRLHEIFCGSAFAVSVIKLKVLAVMFVLPTVIFSMLQVYTAIKPLGVFASYHPLWNEINQFSDCTRVYPLYRSPLINTLRIVGTALYVLMDIFCSFFILRLFLSRLMKLAANLGANQQTKHNRAFTRLCVKTTNLCILSVCLNWIILIKFGGRLPIAILHIDVISNCLSVYLSYDFASKYYKLFFKPCHHLCYSMCLKCCYCCCYCCSVPSSYAEMTIWVGVLSGLSQTGSGTGATVESPRSRSEPTTLVGNIRTKVEITRTVELSGSGPGVVGTTYTLAANDQGAIEVSDNDNELSLF
eukprot:446904_1